MDFRDLMRRITGPALLAPEMIPPAGDEFSYRLEDGRFVLRSRPEGYFTAKAELTSADILALSDTTPFEVLEAPGENKMWLPLGMAIYLHFGTVAYTTHTVVRLDYGDGAGGGSGNWVVQLANALGASASVISFDGSGDVANTDFPELLLNRPLVLYTVGGNPLAGDGTATVNVPCALLDFS